MSIIKVAPRGFDLTDTYAFTGTVSGVDAGSMVKISSQTASASSSISFTGIDSTYRTYCFKFINIHPSVDDVNISLNGSTNGGSSWGITKTTTYFASQHAEDDSVASLFYSNGNDQAQQTADQNLGLGSGNDNDQSNSGELWLFNPSSTTYVKHFMSRVSMIQGTDKSFNIFVAGYFNTTSAINAIRIAPSSGTIDDGTIVMYGIA